MSSSGPPPTGYPQAPPPGSYPSGPPPESYPGGPPPGSYLQAQPPVNPPGPAGGYPGAAPGNKFTVTPL